MKRGRGGVDANRRNDLDGPSFDIGQKQVHALINPEIACPIGDLNHPSRARTATGDGGRGMSKAEK